METAVPIREQRHASVRAPRALAFILETATARAHDVAHLLTREHYEPVSKGDVRSLIRAIRLTPPDVVVSCVGSDPARCRMVVEAIRRESRRIPVILLVDQGSEELAVAALRAGATDYVKRSEAPDALRASLTRFSSRRRAAKDRPVGSAAGRLSGGHRLLGASAPMTAIRQWIRRVAGCDSNLLVTGETGTGKQLVAELVHCNSPRRKNPFVSVNCAAIPESLLENELFGHERGAFTGADRKQTGKLEAAAGGTLFLDEIGDMSECTQAKVLRAIEYKEVQRLGSARSEHVDARIIAATNRDIEGLVASGKFRQDLYFRLDVARIEIPPLRDRREDIFVLCRHFIDGLNQRFAARVERLTREVEDYLFLHSWPGNVRELKNVLEAAFVNQPARHIQVEDLPAAFLRRFGDAGDKSLPERDRILWALHSCRWNKSRAAKKLRWSRMTLYRKMDRYHILKAGGVDNEL